MILRIGETYRYHGPYRRTHPEADVCTVLETEGWSTAGYGVLVRFDDGAERVTSVDCLSPLTHEEG